MTFKEFKEMQQNHIKNMVDNNDFLFKVDIDNDELWNTYLDSFPPGTNSIYKERREFDCSACRSFVKHLGSIVTIKNNILTTIWDFTVDDPKFQVVITALTKLVRSKTVRSVFYSNYASVGCDSNKYMDENETVHTWHHMFYKLPKKFVKPDVGTITSNKNSLHDVFKRSLDEISIEAIEIVLELISQNSLYKGAEWDHILKDFLNLKKKYEKLNNKEKELFSWEQSMLSGDVLGRIKNHSIGVLLVDINKGLDLNEAVKKYEAIVAPSNYKRPKEIFTKKMLEEAKTKVEELGLMNSLGRRFALLDDITVNNILFCNKDSASNVQGLSDPFAEMESNTKTTTKNFDRVSEIPIEDFITNVLPTATNLEVFVDNNHEENLVSLITAKDMTAPTLFKWNNPFSWAYKGNMTDSMKERVKTFGGNVEGVLRFSIQWNENNDTLDDLDAHCKTPNKEEISFSHMRSRCGGFLDVDIINPEGVAVENIAWNTTTNMEEGVYKFFVHCYSKRNGKSGFSAEIEFNKQIYSFSYKSPLRQNENIQVATVEYKNGKFTIKPASGIECNELEKTMWNIGTKKFHPVTVCMYSPNYWDEQNGLGNKHYFFMLKNCLNDETPNGFFNEYLKKDLITHKRVFAALGSKMKVSESGNQLSGLGFSSTKNGSLICKVTGKTTRTVKIVF